MAFLVLLVLVLRHRTCRRLQCLLEYLLHRIRCLVHLVDSVVERRSGLRRRMSPCTHQRLDPARRLGVSVVEVLRVVVSTGEEA